MVSKIGEWSGKVRSTPTPKETLRTVNVRPTPEPCTRITTPWKIWTREREPSTTLTCTLTVSPARKSGRSSRLRALPRSVTAAKFLTLMSLLTDATGQPRIDAVQLVSSHAQSSEPAASAPPVAGARRRPPELDGPGLPFGRL